MDALEFVVKKALDTTKESTELTDRDKHLNGLTVTLTRGCQQCMGSRIENDLKAGISHYPGYQQGQVLPKGQHP